VTESSSSRLKLLRCLLSYLFLQKSNVQHIQPITELGPVQYSSHHNFHDILTPPHYTLALTWTISLQCISYTSGHQPMVREKILVVRGEIWTLFAIFMIIILFHYILIRLLVTDTGPLTIFALLRWIKFHINKIELLWSLFYRCLYLFKKNSC
jgi:hypothetical protein